MIPESVLSKVIELSKKYEIDCLKSNSLEFITGDPVDLTLFKKRFPWGKISKEDNLDDSFVEFFKDNLDWYTISRVCKLSETFIEKYEKHLNWSMISQHQDLSESFMEKHKSKLDWSKIVSGQVLSDEFILRNKSMFPSVHALFIFQKLSPDFKNKYFNH